MITFVYESFNHEHNAYDYNNWPANWIVNGVKLPPINSYSARYPRLPDWIENNIESKLYNSLKANEKYFYPIILDTWLYFDEMEAKNFSFNFIDERIIADVYNNKAKIVLISLFESYRPKDFVILNKWCTNYNFNKNQVYFLDGNCLGPSLCKDFNFTALVSNEMLHWNEPQTTFKLAYKPDSERNLYLSFNRLQRSHRTLLVCELMKNNLLSRGLVSYKGGEQTLDDMKNDLQRVSNTDLSSEASMLYTMSPMTLDIDDMVNKKSLKINDESLGLYEKTLMSIVTETMFTNDTIFFTEKTWKTICIGHPFILVSSRHSLKKLKEFGFKTFSKWIDESYDECENLEDRIKIIMSELLRLSNLSTEQLMEIRSEMSDIIQLNKLIHAANYNKLSRINNDFGFCSQLNKIWQTF